MYITSSSCYGPSFMFTPSDGSGPTQRWRLRTDALKGGKVPCSMWNTVGMQTVTIFTTNPHGFLKLSIWSFRISIRCCADTNLDEKYFSPEELLGGIEMEFRCLILSWASKPAAIAEKGPMYGFFQQRRFPYFSSTIFLSFQYGHLYIHTDIREWSIAATNL